MSQINAFAPAGNTVSITPSGASSGAALTSIVGTSGLLQVRVRNLSTQEAFIVFGATAPTAVAPTTGTPANGMPVAAGATEVFTPPVGSGFIAAIQLVAGTGNLYVTNGEGV